MSAAEGVAAEHQNQTLYVNNLNERIDKQELRRTLYALFSSFGAVLDVVALRTLRMRGQAHIVFAETSAAARARTQMQDFPLFDKPMKVQFARSRSDAVARLDNSLNPQMVKQRKAEQAKLTAEAEARVRAGGKLGVKKSLGDDSSGTADRKRKAGAGDVDGDLEGESAAKRARAEVTSLPRPHTNPPHKILLVENLPNDCTDDMLLGVFREFVGFQQVRLTRVKGRAIAFIDFDTAAHAGEAIKGKQHHELGQDHAIVISFAKQ